MYSILGQAENYFFISFLSFFRSSFVDKLKTFALRMLFDRRLDVINGYFGK